LYAPGEDQVDRSLKEARILQEEGSLLGEEHLETLALGTKAVAGKLIQRADVGPRIEADRGMETGAAVLIREVVVELAAGTVQCRFVSGSGQ
jgi:hypothetical protein